jgi:pimeloyl-ACP methyl ester carboxylesterase
MRFIKAQPTRVSAAVLVQPSGRIGPESGRAGGFERWRVALQDHPEATDAAFDGFRANLYAHDFVYTVSRDFVRTCETPLLVLAGNDDAHPFAVAEELARLAPNVQFIPEWKEGAALTAALTRIREFLKANTPSEIAAR